MKTSEKETIVHFPLLCIYTDIQYFMNVLVDGNLRFALFWFVNPMKYKFIVIQ